MELNNEKEFIALIQNINESLFILNKKMDTLIGKEFGGTLEVQDAESESSADDN